MSEQQQNRIHYHLVRIITENLELLPVDIAEDQPVRVDVGFNFGIDNEQHLLKILFKNVFLQDESPFITIETGCIFAINPEAWELLCDEENNRFTIPQQFAGHLAGLTVSTARGILHQATEDTPLNMFLIPVTNIEEIVREDIQLPLRSE